MSNGDRLAYLKKSETVVLTKFIQNDLFIYLLENN